MFGLPLSGPFDFLLGPRQPFHSGRPTDNRGFISRSGPNRTEYNWYLQNRYRPQGPSLYGTGFLGGRRFTKNGSVLEDTNKFLLHHDL